MPMSDIQRVHDLSMKFVQKFEELYYRCEFRFLPVCRINTHSLLHLSQYLRDCGPACYWSQWTMET